MNQEKIGAFIAECRKERKLTQGELAEKLGVSVNAVSKWERGLNMPDLSLFKPLCNELDITINELMSGEKIKKDEYQKKFEENMIDLNLKTKRKMNRKLIIGLFSLFFLLIVFILFILVYNYYEIDVSYDANMMKCNFTNNKLNYSITGVSVLNTNYVEREIDNNKIYIFHSTINLYNKLQSSRDYRHSLSNLLGGEKVASSSFLELEEESDVYDNVIVYYTNKPLYRINKFNNEEIKKELKSNLKMCSLK